MLPPPAYGSRHRFYPALPPGLGADFVIAVDVRRASTYTQKLRHSIDIFIRSAQVTGQRYTETLIKQADYVISPILQDVQWSEFDRFDEMVEAGEKAAHNCIFDLKRAVKAAKFRNLLEFLKLGNKDHQHCTDFNKIDIIQLPS